ncbi:MAG: xanthine dehydrogenase family protein molybdopterin-binding subunit [Hyphomicrobiales bacterium]|nr:xanthine dehydrogenase family protein molybdopterin-binding subunit [Hyphomicrobiales bacterium]
MTKTFSLDRRAFFLGAAATGAGLSIGLAIPVNEAHADAVAPEINAWVVVKPDDTVAIRIARSEMGQGTLTGLAQLVAEELACDWSKVTTEYPTPGESWRRKRPWGEFTTGGSRGIRTSHEYVRKGGAAARMMLVQAAADAWGVPAAECKAQNSVVTHVASGRTTTYGKVADAAAKLTPPANPPLKDPKDWTIAGKPLKRLDTRDKTTGRMTYGLDVKLPGMLNAAIRECPVFGGKVKSFDAARVAGMKGVKSVVLVGDSAVAVVADTWWRAQSALDALPIVWDEGANANVTSASIAQWLHEGLDDAQPAFVGNANGDAKGALAKAAKTVEAVYAYPYQNHATMEPMNATALWTPDKCEVWTGTQNGEAAFAMTVAASGLPPEKCEVYKQMLGGGFGRRGNSDFVRQAVLIAKHMPGVPVKLIWSREEDMHQGRYHPTTQARLVGGFDANGDLTALRIRISGQSILASLRPEALLNGKDMATFAGLTSSGDAALGYSVPNLLVDHSMRNPHVPPGFWRGVNVNQNAIYIECFMDELAHATGQEPLAFRRKLMKAHPKNLAVLNAVAERIGWDKPPAQGVYRGIAHHMAYGSYVAAAAEISVADGAKIKIHRLVAATDPGYAVNPAQIERQVAGSFVYGLSALFYGECTVKGGRIEQSNFDTYNSMRIAEMPAVEAIVMPSGGFWGGVGEPTICVAAPAVLNAYFNATGKRVRSVPLKNQSIGFA